MISFRTSMTLPLIGMLVALAGCSAGGTGAGDPVDTAENPASVAANDQAPSDGPAKAARPHGPRGGGPAFLARAALNESSLNLSAEQRTAIEGAIKANRPKAPEFDKTRVTALANAIRTGKVEALPASSKTDDPRAAFIASSAKTLTTLHDTLTKEQRVALIDSVTRHMTERSAKRAEAKKAWAERASKDGAEKQGRARGAKRMHGHGGPMAHMLRGLDLTAAQKQALRTKLDTNRPKQDASPEAREARKARFEAGRAAMQAKLQTFVNDDFDATSFVTPPARDGERVNPAERFQKDLAVITSVLEPAQREKLATRIEQGPQMKIQKRFDGKKFQRRSDAKKVQRGAR